MKVLTGEGGGGENAANVKPRRGNAEPRMRGLWMHSLHYLNVWHYSCPPFYQPECIASYSIFQSSITKQCVVYLLLHHASSLAPVHDVYVPRYSPIPPPCLTLSLTKFLKFRTVSLCVLTATCAPLRVH